eukprot:CAMPEP_0113818624 /NCGR_PEP_ID=MMETSP0328-20130328/333_1 /TAXON_ID=39455 /ORGANISM="Alexandrium minutum" /LENGTH=231 /DNA_ID=CAMNT_0000786559 /DNA_START=86 /DNA_END=781 /DNA_ORIENTATION=- /assembly_acc=CAM_ASM_000350
MTTNSHHTLASGLFSSTARMPRRQQSLALLIPGRLAGGRGRAPAVRRGLALPRATPVALGRAVVVVGARVLDLLPAQHPDGHLQDEEEPQQLDSQEGVAEGTGGPRQPWHAAEVRDGPMRLDGDGPDDVAQHEDARDEENNHEGLEEPVCQELPMSPPSPGLGQVVADLGDMQRDVRRVHQEHHHHTYTVPSRDVGNADEQQRDYVVDQHLEKVFPPRLENEQGHAHLCVA